MTHLRLSTSLRGLLAVALCGAVSAAQDPEYQFVQSLDSDEFGPLRETSELAYGQAGRFLPGGQDRAGALVLRTHAGVTEALYLDSLGVWNSGTRYPVDCFSPVSAAVLPGAGLNGLDGIATVSTWGLEIFESNAAGTDFTQVLFHSGWFSVERLFSVVTDLGVEIHGYQPQTGTVRRGLYDPVTHVLTPLAGYTALPGQAGAVAIDFQAGAGPELVVWNEAGDVQIRSQYGSLIHSTLATTNFVQPGTSQVQVMPNSSGDVLIWAYGDALQGDTVVHEYTAPTVDTETVFPGVWPTAMQVADWSGDDSADLVLALLSVLGDNTSELHCVPSAASTGDLSWASGFPIELIEGDYYTSARVDALMAIDSDRDGDEDLFALGEAQSTMQTVLSGAQDWRVVLRHNGYPIMTGTRRMDVDVTLDMTSNYAELLSSHNASDLRLRLRYWPRGSAPDFWDWGSREERFFDLPDLDAGETTVGETLDLDFSSAPAWAPGEYHLLAHLAIVSVDAQEVVVEEFATSIWSVTGESDERDDLEERLSRELTGSEAQAVPTKGKSLHGDGVSTGRPSGDPPVEDPPSGAGG